ncbi:hypothetical protein B0H13DRAFT_2247979 [Mycena leptocephala]|nr:hypothetical protein B0H13DRAFT_2247979 [Mycena leptocephala]
MAPSSLLSRLYQDLAELHASPYPGVAVFTNDADVRQFCLVLTPPSGPWKNLSLHFDVVLPENWPVSPPKVSSSVGINGYSGGYTPALTLRGLFLQFLTFFSSSRVRLSITSDLHVEQEYGGYVEIGESVNVRYARESDLVGRRQQSPYSRSSGTQSSSLRKKCRAGPISETTKSPRPNPSRLHRIEEINHRWTSTFKSIRYWQCKHCPYGTDAVPHCVGAVAAASMDVDQSSPLLAPPASCRLELLNDDVLFTLASHLPSESVITFSAAYPRLHEIVESMHVLLQRELSCFFLRTPLSESVLGIGIALDFRSRTLVEKRDFSFFLPLAFSRPHFERVYPHIWRRLEEIDKERQEIVGVIYRMMTNIVVSLMRSCDDALSAPVTSKKTLLHASEKAVVAYCHLFHLLICLCRTDPVILRDATDRLRRFVDKKDSRSKTHVPDMGELIVLVMLVVCRPPVGGGPPIQWSSLAGPFLEEVLIRNVRWILKDSPHLEVMEQGPSDYRLAETFFRSKTSLRLVMFQISFLDLFFKAYGSDISRLDNNYGFPEKELPERMVEEVKEIYKINTWPAFFTRVRYPAGVAFGKERFSNMLRDAVKTSAARRYHNAAPGVGLRPKVFGDNEQIS